jgi:hypothetical protein
METNLLTFQFLLKCYHNNIGSMYSFNFYTVQTSVGKKNDLLWKNTNNKAEHYKE